jgi:quercetin dioxygenase-like cupin family protein
MSPHATVVPEHVAHGEGRVYAVAGGNHVRVVVDAKRTDGALDLVEVLARPGGGPPAHSHLFTETFVLLEGELVVEGEREGAMVPVAVMRPGDTAFVPPWVPHTTRNESDRPARFLVFCQPSAMAEYFAAAGVEVPDLETAPAAEPPGPDVLAEIAARLGIRFWQPSSSVAG